MLSSRTAIGFTIALLALPATAAARAADLTAGGETGASHMVRLSYRDYYGAAGRPDMNAQSLSSPDAADAARAGDIAKAIEHYERSQPVPTTAGFTSPPQAGFPVGLVADAESQSASHDNATAWPEIAFAGIVLLAAAGGVVRVRVRRTHRIAA